MTREEKIDKILERMANIQGSYSIKELCSQLWGTEILKTNEPGLIIREMQESKLVDFSTPTNHFITPHGKRVWESGGYVKYLKEAEEKIKANEEYRKLSVDLAKSNIEANISQKRHRRFVIIFMIIAAVFSLINIILYIKNNW